MSNTNIVRTEFAAAINQIAKDRNIDPEDIHEAIRQSLVSAFRRQFDGLEEGYHYYVNLDVDTGESQILKAPATKIDEETGEALEWDESKSEDVTPAGFGRIAAQTAKQVILQKIRESERNKIIADFSQRVGEVISGHVLRMQGRSVLIDLGRGQGFMPPEEQMRGEFYRVNSRISVLVKEIRETHRGKVILVSRADKLLVSKLFEREVPEVASGAVEIKAIAREAGVRTKLAVASTQDGVDPVGACVGQRGVRVQEVIRELNNEKLDIIPYTEDLKTMVLGALAPAEGLVVEINEKKHKIVVTAPDDQLSLAIGRGGQNVRLAAKLLDWNITIQSGGGTVKAEATGDEEYEIDTVEGLSEEAREFLIEYKLTTFADLSRFPEKWQEVDELTDQEKETLQAGVEKFDAEEATRVNLDRPRPGDKKVVVDETAGRI